MPIALPNSRHAAPAGGSGDATSARSRERIAWARARAAATIESSVGNTFTLGGAHAM